MSKLVVIGSSDDPRTDIEGIELVESILSLIQDYGDNSTDTLTYQANIVFGALSNAIISMIMSYFKTDEERMQFHMGLTMHMAEALTKAMNYKANGAHLE